MKYHQGPFLNMRLSDLAGLIVVIFFFCAVPFIFLDPHDKAGWVLFAVMAVSIAVAILAHIVGRLRHRDEMPEIFGDDTEIASERTNLKRAAIGAFARGTLLLMIGLAIVVAFFASLLSSWPVMLMALGIAVVSVYVLFRKAVQL